MRATSDVEKSISMIVTFPSSLLNIFPKGSVWYIRKPFEVPGRTFSTGLQYRVETRSYQRPGSRSPG
jgi:hypothetical protein